MLRHPICSSKIVLWPEILLSQEGNIQAGSWWNTSRLDPCTHRREAIISMMLRRVYWVQIHASSDICTWNWCSFPSFRSVRGPDVRLGCALDLSCMPSKTGRRLEKHKNKWIQPWGTDSMTEKPGELLIHKSGMILLDQRTSARHACMDQTMPSILAGSWIEIWRKVFSLMHHEQSCHSF